jgi:hypothetical protein
MACADVATAKVKTSAINLSILSSHVRPQYERLPKRAGMKSLAFADQPGPKGERQHS